ncbi:HU family DNA-binding protein [Bacteroides sp.]|uniref:HU family DNA-binding protein n=1 Tax=Bacteroides sp. TaxID=29523 RepID=UPI0026297261|nr:HU family DNA-binding protein [Bacteroides sp.]MDD3039211.1 DNA-binding protein [Bacteroides sp.]
MARYIMEEMPDIHKTGKKVTYPKFARIQKMSTKELAKRIEDVSGFSAGNIEGVFLQASIELAHLMANGYSVKIDGIGTFTPALALCEGKEREEAGGGGTHRNAQSIVVGGVNFRVDRTMIRNINSRCNLERAPWKRQSSSQKYTPEERLRLALEYLDKHTFLTVREYRRLTGLLQTAATKELKQWAYEPNSGIGIDGVGSHRVYVKKKPIE